METAESHLRPDGTVWPPVTPEPPLPPGYRDPIGEEPDADGAGGQPAAGQPAAGQAAAGQPAAGASPDEEQ